MTHLTNKIGNMIVIRAKLGFLLTLIYALFLTHKNIHQ